MTETRWRMAFAVFLWMLAAVTLYVTLTHATTACCSADTCRTQHHHMSD